MSLPKPEIKRRLIEKIKDNPLISSLCHQLGISRATYYRWIEEDKKFKSDIWKAQKVGRLAICDLAESKIISLVKSEKENVSLSAAKYILDNNSPVYKKSNFGYQKMKLENRYKQLVNEKSESIEKAINQIQFVLFNKRENKNQ